MPEAPDLPIRIRYHAAWGPLMLALAAVNVGLWALTGRWLQLGLAVMLTIIGVLYITQAFLVISENTIEAKNLMGITLRRFRFGSLTELDVVPGGIAVGTGDSRQRLKVSNLLIRKSDMAALAAAIERRRATG